MDDTDATIPQGDGAATARAAATYAEHAVARARREAGLAGTAAGDAYTAAATPAITAAVLAATQAACGGGHLGADVAAAIVGQGHRAAEALAALYAYSAAV